MTGNGKPRINTTGLHPDALVRDSLDKLLGDARPLPASSWLFLRRVLIRLAVGTGLPLLWLVLGLKNLRPRPAPTPLPDNYILFLPNLNQNLAGMTAVCAGLRDRPLVFCCPHTVSRQRLERLLEQHHGGEWHIITVHWIDFVRLRMAPESVRLCRDLLRRYDSAAMKPQRLIAYLCKLSLYSLVCRDLRESAFTGVFAGPPAVILAARPKSHYGTLPFLHAAAEKGIPAYYLAHTHIDASRHFQYQVFRPGLFRAFFLFSHACKGIAEQNFTVDGELIVTGDPCLDGGMIDVSEIPLQGEEKSPGLRIMYAASVFFGQDSMCDLVDIVAAIPEARLSIKTRPPGHNSKEIKILLKGRDTSRVSILDHAEVGPIEEILDRADLLVGCATNAAVNAVLRGVPALVYIHPLDQAKIDRRKMDRLPYEEFGIPVLTEKESLRQKILELHDDGCRREFLHEQRRQAARMYPNLKGRPATEVICERLRACLE